MKIIKNIGVPFESNENHKKHKIQRENQEIHNNLRIPREIHENMKIITLHLIIMKI